MSRSGRVEVLRVGGMRLFFCFGLLVLAASFGGAGVNIITGDHPHAHGPVVGAGIFFGIAAIWLLLAGRLLRAAVVIDDEHVIVRNLIRTHRFTW